MNKYLVTYFCEVGGRNEKSGEREREGVGDTVKSTIQVFCFHREGERERLWDRRKEGKISFQREIHHFISFFVHRDIGYSPKENFARADHTFNFRGNAC